MRPQANLMEAVQIHFQVYDRLIANVSHHMAFLSGQAPADQSQLAQALPSVMNYTGMDSRTLGHSNDKHQMLPCLCFQNLIIKCTDMDV